MSIYPKTFTNFITSTHFEVLTSENKLKLLELHNERKTWYDFKKMDVVIDSFNQLPEIDSPVEAFLNEDCVRLQLAASSTLNGEKDTNNSIYIDTMKSHAEKLIPWRKGPFHLFGVGIDAEWQSNIKWNRVKHKLQNLIGKRILDIGANSGYYMFRLAAQNPKMVLGIDPNVSFKLQFESINKYAKLSQLYYELFGMEHVTFFPGYFDIVLCMGILYHNKSPIEALKELKNCIAPAGHMLLETLIIPGDDDMALCPYPTYGKMKNAYFIPTQKCLKNWVRRAGFKNIEVISLDVTTTQEQRNTSFYPHPNESLEHFLDPLDRTKTIEGYPAHQRICMWVS